MSVYVGIDVHRKRSQVAVIDSGGEVLANRNVPDGTETILGVIGGLPPGTPAAIRGRVRLGVAAGLLEDYGFDPHLVHPLQCQAIASARLKNDKGRCRDPGAAAARGPAAGGVDRAAGGAAAAGAAAAPRPAGAAAGAAAEPDPRGPGRPRPGPALRLLERPRPGLARRARSPGGLAGGGRGRPGPDRRPAGAGRPGSTPRSASGPGPARGSRSWPSCPAWAPSPPWSSSPRPATLPGSGPRASSPPGPGSPRPCAARTAPSGTATSPNRARRGCGGFCAKQRRPPSGTPATPPATPRSPAAAARRSPPPRSPASS